MVAFVMNSSAPCVIQKVRQLFRPLSVALQHTSQSQLTSTMLSNLFPPSLLWSLARSSVLIILGQPFDQNPPLRNIVVYGATWSNFELIGTYPRGNDLPWRQRRSQSLKDGIGSARGQRVYHLSRRGNLKVLVDMHRSCSGSLLSLGDVGTSFRQ